MPGLLSIRDRKQVRLITPAAISERTLESFLARYFAPTPGIAPVRNALIKFPDIRARGAPVSASFSITMRIERGRPLERFSLLEPYHFSPATWKRPPRYAVMAIKRLSGPFFGILGNCGSSGKEIRIP